MTSPYAQVKDMYELLHEAGVVREPLKDWSAKKLAQTGNPMYQHGVNDNLLKRGSYWLDKGIEATPLPDWGESFGRAFGGTFFGDEGADIGAEMGRHLPRGTVNFAPMFIPGGGIAGAVAKYGLSGLLAGSQAYAETDSPAAGLMAAGTTMAMPGVARGAEILALKAMGTKPLQGTIVNNLRLGAGMPNATQNRKWWLPENRLQGVTSQAAGQVAASGFGELGAIGQTAMTPGAQYEFSPTTLLLDLTLGQVPFGAVYALKQGKVHLGGRTTRKVREDLEYKFQKGQEHLEAHRLNQEKLEEDPLVGIPMNPLHDKMTPTEAAQLQFEIARVSKTLSDAKHKRIEMSEADFNALHVEEQHLNAVWWQKTEGNAVPGVAVGSDSFKPQMRGSVHFERPETGYRIIKVEDPMGITYKDGTPVEPGDLVGFAAKYEPEGNGADGTWTLPEGVFTKVTDKRFIDKENINAGEPLPLQDADNLPTQLTSVDDIAKTYKALESAESPADVDAIAARMGVDESHINYSIFKQAKYRIESAAEAAAISEMMTELQLSSSIGEVRAVAARMNHELMQRGRPPLPEKMLYEAEKHVQKRQSLNLEVQRREVQAKLNKQARKLADRQELSEKLVEEQKAFYEFEAEVIKQAADETVPEQLRSRYAQVRDLAQSFKDASGAADTGRRRKVLESGLFKKHAAEWVKGDEPIDTLHSKFAEAIRTGAGLQSVKPKATEALPPEVKETVQDVIGSLVEAIESYGLEDAILDAKVALESKNPVAELRSIMRDYGIAATQWDDVVSAHLSPVKTKISSNHAFTTPTLKTHRLGKADGLFFGSKVNQYTDRGKVTTKELPTKGDNVLVLKNDALQNEGDASNAPLAELLPRGLLSLDSDLYSLVRGREGVEQPLDTDLLTAIQLKRDGFDVIHLVDPEDSSNVVSVDLRHVSSEQLLQNLEARLKEADEFVLQNGKNEFEAFNESRWNVRRSPNKTKPVINIPKLPRFSLVVNDAPSWSRIGDKVRFKFNDKQEAAAHFDKWFDGLLDEEERLRITDDGYEVAVSSILEMENVELSGFNFLTGEESSDYKNRNIAEFQSLVDAAQFSLANAKRAAQKPLKPYVPNSVAEHALISQIGTTGTEAIQYLKSSTDSWMKAWGFELEEITRSKGDLVSVQFAAGLDSAGFQLDLKNGRAQITLDGQQLLRMSRLERERVVAHELVHSYTAEQLLTNDAFRTKVDNLRKEALQFLPEELRVRVKGAISRGWYQKWTAGETTMKSLHPDEALAEHLYSFLTPDEFLANGLNHPQTQKMLQSIKTKDGTLFGSFTKTLKELFGKEVPDSMFAEVLDVTHRIVRHDNMMAAVRTTVERHLENQGHTPVDAQDYAARALAMLPTAHKKNADGLLMEILNQPATSRRDELAEKQLEIAFSKRGPEMEMVQSTLKNLGLRDGVDGVKDFAQEALLGELGDLQPILELMPLEVRHYVTEKASDVNAVLQGLTLVTDGNVARIMGWNHNEGQAATVAEVVKNAQRFEKADAEVAARVVEMSGLVGVDFQQFTQNVNHSPKSIHLGDAVKEQQISKFTQFWMRAATLAQAEPLFAEVVTKGYQLLANARNATIRAMQPFSTDLRTGQTSKAATDFLFDTIKQRPVVKAVDELLYQAQLAGLKDNSVKAIDYNSPEAKRVLDRLTPQQKDDVIQLLARKDLSQKIGNEQTLESMRHVGELQAATLIADQVNLPPEQVVALAKEMFDIHLASPEDMSKQARLLEVQKRLELPQFLTLLKATETQAKIYQEWKQVFDNNPWWTSARRYGVWQAELSNGKRISSDDKAEINAIAKSQGVRVMKLTKRGQTDEAPHFGTALESAIPRLRELEANMHSMLEQVLDPSAMEAVKRRSLVEQFAIEAREGGLTNVQARGRNLGKGAELVPYLKNHFSFLRQNATFWARNRYAAEVNLLLKNPAYKERPDVVQMIKQQGENILYPDPEHAGTVTRFVTHYLLGFNAASAMINGTQLFVRGAAELTRLNGNPLKSYKSLLSSLHELASGKWTNVEHQWLMEKAVHDGEVGLSRYDEVQALDEVVSTNIIRRIAGEAPVSPGEYAGRGLGALANASMFMFRQVEMLNTRGALLMAFDHWRSTGLSKEAAYLKATEFNHFVNDTGGRVNRSLGAFGGRDPFSRSTAMVANSMMAYVFGTAGQLATYVKQGFFQGRSLTPAQKFKARTALVQMLAVQFVAAGTMGMPFMAGAVAIVEKAFPELELTRKIREFFNELFSDDEEAGNPLADIAMTGVPSLMGWDLQSRMSMGSIPGVNDYDGFMPQNLLGAPLSVGTGLVKGTTKLAQGDITGTRDILPPAFKKLFDLLANEGKMTDYRDRPILEPTPGETMGALVGFNPKRLADFNAASRMAYSAERIANAQRTSERHQWANEVLRGNVGTVRQQLLQKLQEDPNFDATAEIRRIAQAAEELTFPRDLRREGHSEQRSQVLRMFNLQPTAQDSEQQRVLFRQAIEEKFGLRSKSRTRLKEAQVLDALRAQYPNATRAELRRMVSRAGQRRPSPLELQQYSLPGLQPGV